MDDKITGSSRDLNSGDMKNMSNQRKRIAILGLFVIVSVLTQSLLAGNEPQPDPAKGETLFKKSKCLSCHSDDIFTRKERIVNDFKQLEKQVRVCDSQLDVNWFDDEIRDVVSYLNKTYYKFSPLP